MKMVKKSINIKTKQQNEKKKIEGIIIKFHVQKQNAEWENATKKCNCTQTAKFKRSKLFYAALF